MYEQSASGFLVMGVAGGEQSGAAEEGGLGCRAAKGGPPTMYTGLKSRRNRRIQASEAFREGPFPAAKRSLLRVLSNHDNQ